jgi:hypothetical protein
MFKNIELSEINKNNVINSLLVAVLGFFIGLFIVGAVAGDMGFGFYILIMAVFYGLFYWVGSLVILAGVEMLLIRKRSNEKSVLLLLIFEMLIPSLFIVLFVDGIELEYKLVLIGALFMGQTTRWLYLKGTGKMFHTAVPKENNKH